MIQNRLLLSIVLSLLTLFNLHADDAKKIKASLSEATVFFNGAELIHTASSSVTKGVNDISITDLSPNIDVNSLKISTTKGVIVASHEYSQDYTTPKAISSLERTLKDSVKFYQKVISEYNISHQTNIDLLDLLRANKSIGGSQTGLSVAELSKMVDFYKIQSNELNKAQLDLNEKISKARKSLDRINLQLRQESAKNTKSIGTLKLNLTSPVTSSTDITITYFTESANWIPYYDINVPSTTEQIQIASKAKVAQTTGLDWTKVKLSLSTTAPSTSKEAPLFDAWFLDFRYVAPRSTSSARGQLAPLSQNMYSYDDEKSINQRQVLEKDEVWIRGVSTIDNNNKPLIIVNGVYSEDMSNLDPSMIKSYEVLKDASATAMYGARGANGVVVITTKGLTDYINREEGELSTVYNIELPYTILGNGKVQSIDLQTHSVSAEFKHYSVPKLDSEVFVLAEIADWQKLGLLSGKANVTFDGTYVGETVINATSIAKKLSLTLGTDKRVTVKREKLLDFSSQKFLARDTQQDFTYKITVKNNQNKAITMVLKDQYPISKQKDITVEVLKETTPTTHINEEVGVLNWEFELPAGDTKEFKVAYRVKYPKDKDINL